MEQWEIYRKMGEALSRKIAHQIISVQPMHSDENLKTLFIRMRKPRLSVHKVYEVSNEGFRSGRKAFQSGVIFIQQLPPPGADLIGVIYSRSWERGWRFQEQLEEHIYKVPDDDQQAS